MKCKKCNATVADGKDKCPNCGASLNKSSNKPLIIITISIIVLLVLLLVFKDRPFTSDPVENGDSTINPTIEAPPQPTVPDTHLIPVMEPEPEPESHPDESKTPEEAMAIARNTVAAAQEYFDYYGQYGQYVTKRGYFYEYTSHVYTLPDDLVELEYLTEEEVEPNTLILYLRPEDLMAYGDVEINNLEGLDQLRLFAAFETTDGFYIASVTDTGGLISREDLLSLFDQYNYLYGDIRQVVYGSSEYNGILSALTSYTGNTEGFDFRYLYCDGKYAVAVLSPKGKTGQINGYVLELVNNRWMVRISNYEAYEKFVQEINAQLIDLNLDLILNCDIRYFYKYINMFDADAIITGMKYGGYITETDEPATFISGIDDFVYFEFTSGKKYIGTSYRTDGIWVMHPVNTYEEAIAKLNELHYDPPLFIVRQYES